METSGLPPWLVIVVALVTAAGSAGIGGVVVNWRKDRRAAELAADTARHAGEQAERSVAIDEVDKAIPGLGLIITQLQEQVVRQEATNARQAARIDEQDRTIERLTVRNQELVGTVFNLESRVDELERELAHERSRGGPQ